MELPEGETIFDKMNMPYDQLRVHNPPIEPILDYYRRNLQPGEQIWWLGRSSNLVIRFWSALSPLQKNSLQNKGFVFYPEIFSSRSDKFNRMAFWLVQDQSVVCPNMRDIYSAGGQMTIRANGNIYNNVPRVLHNALIRLPGIINVIQNTPLTTLSKCWGRSVPSRRIAITVWIRVVARETALAAHLDIVELFNDYMIEHRI